MLILAIVQFAQMQTSYQKIQLNYQPAKCLDGTKPSIYATNTDVQDNILVFFEGGGACGQPTLAQTLISCYQRSKTYFGSSKNDTQKIDGSTQNMLSNNPLTNPNFYNWAKYYVRYCDGTLHQGSRNQPIEFRGEKIYFRGANNTLSN